MIASISVLTAASLPCVRNQLCGTLLSSAGLPNAWSPFPFGLFGFGCRSASPVSVSIMTT